MREPLAGEEPIMDQTVLPVFDPPGFAFNDQPQADPSTPAEFFALRFPECINKYGAAVLERRRLFKDGTLKVTPVALNEDTLAAILGTKDAGDTVFHKTELQFYSRDHQSKYFIPVDVEELKLVLSQLLLKCIADMPGCVDVQPLFNEFRNDAVLNRVIQRAKAVLGVEDEFFSESGPNIRNPVKVPKEAARAFVDRCLVADDAAVLPLRDAFEAYQRFCKAHGYHAVHINQFRPFVAPHVQRRFNRGIRNDLNVFGSSKALGWRGVKLRSWQDSE